MRKKIISLLIISSFLLLLFTKNILIAKSVINAVNIFLTKVFPFLFPMFIIVDLLNYFEIPELLANLFGPFFSKVFHINKYASYAFFLSLFSGSPTNAYIIKTLVEERKLNEQEASYLFSFSFFPNPLFYYSMLQAIFPNQFSIQIKLFIIPLITNLILGFITHPKKYETNDILFPSKKTSFSSTLTTSIKKTMNSLLLILGSITFFFILNTLLNPYNIPFISGIFEMTQGLNALGISNLSLKIKELWTLLFISFGGLSIHLQIKSILDDAFSLAPFFKIRFFECLFSFIWIFLL